MNVTKRAVIYHRNGADPQKDKIIYDYNGKQTILVGITDEEQAIPLAKQLVADGVQLIELCGGLGVIWQAKVQAAIDRNVPVAAVLFGVESLVSAADYNARYTAGQGPFIEAFITIHPGADPTVDRKVIADDFGHTTFVAVSDEDTAAKVGAELAAEKVQLIELYGEFTPAGAAKVIEATGNGKVPVGVNAYGPDSYRL